MAQDAGGSAAATDASMWPSLLMFAGLFLIMYFMLIRPQRKRQKEHQELVNGLNKGDEIVLSSGLLGRISALSDDYLTLDTGSVTLQFQRVAVHAVLPKGTLKGIGQG
ncbi:MAG: preprotein translocase subunit YajC [Cellvibrionales bacterium]|nr:preprotein translocase subunit YajC [Cellvibrionales bacterium]